MKNKNETKNSKYLIFIPVYNEEESVDEVITQLQQYNDVADILVIDDGSTDKTTEILKKIKGIRHISHSSNQGYGATLQEGFHYAMDKDYPYVITIDSDKQHQPEEIEKFIRLNEKSDFDIISGSRYMVLSEDHYKEAPEDRREVNQRITKRIKEITGYDLTDSFCGFKLYNVEALQKLNMTEDGYGMPLQLWLQAWKNGLTVKEIPVELIYFDHQEGVSSSFENVCERYRYYLKTIEKELEDYENISTRSAS